MLNQKHMKGIIPLICASVLGLCMLSACSTEDTSISVDSISVDQAKQELNEVYQNQITNATFGWRMELDSDANEIDSVYQVITGEFDLNGAAPVGHMRALQDDDIMEVYVQTNGAALINNGRSYWLSPSDPSYAYASEALNKVIESFDASELSALLDLASDIQKVEYDDQKTYMITIGPDRLKEFFTIAMQLSGEGSDLSLIPDDAICSCDISVGNEGYVSGYEIGFSGTLDEKFFDLTLLVDISNIGTTTVPVAPAA